MTFKESLKCFNQYRKFIFPNKLSMCRVDLLFRKVCINNNFTRNKNNQIGSKIYIVNLILVIYSIFVILKVKLLNIKEAHYMIDINNNDSNYDSRSKWMLDVVEPNKTINFMHINDIKYSIFNLFNKNKKNTVYFESFYYVLSPFLKKKRYKYETVHDKFINNISEMNQDFYNISYYIYKINRIIIKFLNIKKFIMLDDPRYTNEFKLICNEFNIPTIGYMHARFNEYHIGIFEFPFDIYFVWNEYFKNKLLQHPNYKNKKIVVVGSPKFNQQYEIIKKTGQNILWLGESNVDYNTVFNYIKILKDYNYNIIFRDKPGNRIEKIDRFLTDMDIPKDTSKTYFESLIENEISIVIATYSTTLMESWLLGIPSVILKTDYDYASHLWEDGLIDVADENNLLKIIYKNLDLSYEERLNRRKKIWGDNYVYDERLIKEVLEG